MITGLSAGGAETQLGLLLRHLRHDHEVVALYDVGRVGREMMEGGVRVYDLGMRGNRQVLSVFRLAALMRNGRYDVVHVHLYRACVYGRLAARLAGVSAVVTTEHSIGDTQIEGRPKTAAVRFLYLATDRLSDATVAVSPKVRCLLADWGVPEGKIRVIPNGVDFDRFAFDERARHAVRKELGIPPGSFVAGSVGRLHRGKRYDALLEASGPFLERGGWLLLVGGGDEEGPLRRMARRTPHPDRVVFAGERGDVPRVLSAMDLFVSPSQEETFGLSVLEAAASGLRCVVAACPALDGVRLERVRRVSGEAHALRGVLLQEYGRDRQAEPDLAAARQRYDVRSVARALDGLYENLTG